MLNQCQNYIDTSISTNLMDGKSTQLQRASFNVFLKDKKNRGRFSASY